VAGGFVLHGSPHSLPTYKVALMLRLCDVGFRHRQQARTARQNRATPWRMPPAAARAVSDLKESARGIPFGLGL